MDYVRARPLTSGTGFTSRATLGVKIKASDESQVAALLDATAYEALLEDE